LDFSLLFTMYQFTFQLISLQEAKNNQSRRNNQSCSSRSSSSLVSDLNGFDSNSGVVSRVNFVNEILRCSRLIYIVISADSDDVLNGSCFFSGNWSSNFDVGDVELEQDGDECLEFIGSEVSVSSRSEGEGVDNA